MLTLNRMQLILAGTCILLGPVGAFGQADRYIDDGLPAKLVENLDRIDKKVSMDRARYLPGEPAVVQVELVNSTSEALAARV